MGLFSRKKKAEPAVETALTDLVVPLIAGGAWFAASEEQFSRIPDFPDDAKPCAVPLTSELWVTYATDPSGAWELVQRGQTGQYGDAESLRRTAIANLIRRVAADVVVEGAGGRYRIQTPSEPDLACSLLLVPELWSSRMQLDGSAVICAPTRVELLVCGAEDQDAVAALRGFGSTLFEEARGKPVTTALHVAGPAGLAVLD